MSGDARAREVFERLAKPRGLKLHRATARGQTFGYGSRETQLMWQGFRMGWKAREEEQKEAVDAD